MEKISQYEQDLYEVENELSGTDLELLASVEMYRDNLTNYFYGPSTNIEDDYKTFIGDSEMTKQLLRAQTGELISTMAQEGESNQMIADSIGTLAKILDTVYAESAVRHTYDECEGFVRKRSEIAKEVEKLLDDNYRFPDQAAVVIDDTIMRHRRHLVDQR